MCASEERAWCVYALRREGFMDVCLGGEGFVIACMPRENGFVGVCLGGEGFMSVCPEKRALWMCASEERVL